MASGFPALTPSSFLLFGPSVVGSASAGLPGASGVDTAVVARLAQRLAPRLAGIPNLEILRATVGTGYRVQVDACPQHVLAEEVVEASRHPAGYIESPQ